MGPIREENKEELLAKVRAIRLGTTTNIQDALEEVGSWIDPRYDGIALLTPLVLGHDSRAGGVIMMMILGHPAGHHDQHPGRARGGASGDRHFLTPLVLSYDPRHTKSGVVVMMMMMMLLLMTTMK
jgi:hypothetical protein